MGPQVDTVLVYSQYQHDVPRFENVLSRLLPDVAINYATTPEEAEQHFDKTTILYGWGFPSAWLREIPHLRWVQKMGAGVDDIVNDWPSDRGITLTRTDGRLIAARMSEYVLAMILDHNLSLDHARDLQRSRSWTYFEMRALHQLTVGVAGLGEIGSEVAKTLRALQCKVVGWRKSAAPCEFVDTLYQGTDKLPEFVAACDVVVLVLPLTKDTRRVFNKTIFDRFRPGAHFINVGRGGVVEEKDLLAALASGGIARASLDVFAQEPLPADHPFWSHPKVSMTPHVCGPLIPEDVAPHFVANVKAFQAKRRMINIVDVSKQY